MCATSAIVHEWTSPYSPNFVPIPSIQPDTASLMLQIIAKLEELDRNVNAIES